MTEITVEAKIENVRQVTDFLEAELEKLDCPMKAQMQLDVAVDELFSNISMYAYPGAVGLATVRLSFEEASRTVSVTLIDSGLPYNPLEKDDPDVTLSAQDRQVGGLGIFLVKKTMDAMFYERRENQNVVTIQKKL